MDRSIGAKRVATLVGAFDRSPAYAGLADALVLLIGDGRIPVGTRLPSERELTDQLGVSRTTVTRAYGELVESGWATARRGSGTTLRLRGREQLGNRHLVVGDEQDGVINLMIAAPPAPAGTMDAIER